MNVGPNPLRIGPYRIEERLGAGGMGEVFRAWDERLERWVALKVIRPDATVDERARERFRREARAAAGLNHPSIVQIYDILLDSSEGDVLVFELVPGATLARLLREGPLPPSRVVRLGLEIAEGLAVAHARGIVHRDLKPENVLVTPEGHAKILDFGVAKSLLAGDPGLSVAGMVVGTYRSMSPEQARGLAVDGRSDLFTLGSLLYEMATGSSPFLAASALDTMNRVCSYHPPPAVSLAPDLPEPLSRLIDRLLEKDPNRRPQGALEVAAALESLGAGLRTDAGGRAFVADGSEQTTWVDIPRARHPAEERGRRRWWPWAAALAALAALAAGWLALRPGAQPRLFVAVPRPEVGARTAATDLAAAGLRAALLRGLLGLEGVSALAPEQVDPVTGSPREIARAVASDEVLTSRLDCPGPICTVTLSRVAGRDGTLLWTESFQVQEDQPYLLAAAVGGHLRQGYGEHKVRELAALAVEPGDYVRYLTLQRQVEIQDRALTTEEALADLAAIRGRSPRFLEAYVFESGLLVNRFHVRRDRRDLERAFALLRTARRLAPADPRPLAAQLEVALRSDRLEQAEEALAQLAALQPGDPEVSVKRAQLLERRGASGRALALIREAVAQRPSWKYLFAQADMEFRLGQAEAARATLHSLLRQFPSYYAGESLLAQVELQYGDPVRAAEIYARLVERSGQVVDLNNLATTYLLLGRYPEAERQLRRALEAEPENPFAGLNLADALWLQGRHQEAQREYERLVEAVERDPLADTWQLRSVRAQALAHLGRRREAVTVAQQVLLSTPGNAQATLEVAIVYALVGDEASALVSSEKALEQGVEARWFSFPWFAPLRRLPEFQELLRTPARPTRRTAGSPGPLGAAAAVR